MNKEQLLNTCRILINDMEKELQENDIWEALEDIRQIFSHFKDLEAQIDILSPKEEEQLDEIIATLSDIDIDKIKSSKEIIEIIDTISGLLNDFKSKIIFWKSDEMIDLIQNMKSLLEILAKKI